MENQDYRFYAFISYSRKDIKDAKWIHSSLEKFHIPTKLPRPAAAEPIPKPLRCFRDINDLDVMPESFVKGIENALASSKYLIVVCSPHSAQSNASGSHYVDWEIQKFIEVHGRDYAESHILPVIIDGEISEGKKENECLPPTLYTLGSDFLQHNFPILDYGDEKTLTKEAKNDFILKILAFLLQVKYSVLNDRYQRAQKKRRNILLGVAAGLLCVFAAIAVYAGFGWNRARKNLAFSYYMQANNLLQSNDVSHALAYYNKSLQLDDNSVVQDEVYNLITNSSWLVDKGAITALPRKNAKYFVEKELCEKLDATTWFDYQKTNEIKNGVLTAFSDDEVYAVLWQSDGSIHLVEVESGITIFHAAPQNGYTWGKSSISTGFKCLFAADNTLFVYRQDKGESESSFILTVLDLTTMDVTSINEDTMLSHWEVSPDGQFLVYSTLRANTVAELTVYDMQKKQNRWTRREKFPRTEIVFSPDSVHFATTGSIFAADPSANEVQINNCFYEDEKITATVKGTVDTMQFSNDGRRVAVATSKNELNVLKTRDGEHLVKPRLFDKKILGLEFTPDDNNIQVRFQGDSGSETKEYELRVNSLNSETMQTSLYAGFIRDTALLTENYVCNLCRNYGAGFFLEVKNVNDKKDYFITPLNDDIQKLNPLLGFIKKSPSGNVLFVGSGRTSESNAGGMVAVYSVDFNSENYLTYKKQIEFPYPVTDIFPISDRYAIAFCNRTYKDTDKNNIYLIDLSDTEQSIKEYPAGLCLAYTLNQKNELYTVHKDSDGNGTLKKWDTLNLSEKWSSPLEKNMYSPILRADRRGNVFVVTKNGKIIVVDKKGHRTREITSNGTINLIELNDDGSLLLIGTTSLFGGSDVREVEVRNIKTDTVLFKTSYDSENPVSINKVAFSGDSNILHIAGKYLLKKTSGNAGMGFYDAWDMTTSTQFETSFSVEQREVFDFDLLKNGTTLLYTSNGTINKKLFTTDALVLAELEKGAVYQQIGAWTLNQYGVPEAAEFSFSDEVQKLSNPLSQWLTVSGAKRTIHPQSETTVNDALSNINAKRNRELILDIQADNASALDSYYFDVISSVAEKNWRRGKVIDSFDDELAIALAWDNEYANNFWNVVLKDEEALKLYKFQLDNYLKKVPDSEKPLAALRMYYNRIGETEKAQETYDGMIQQYPNAVYIKLLQLNNDTKQSLEEKKEIFANMQQYGESGEAYSFSELQDMWNYYRNNLAMDSSFEEMQQAITWFLKCFKKYLLEEPSNYTSIFLGVFNEIATMTQFHRGGFDFYLQCVAYVYEGVSDSTKILLRLEQQRQAVAMMNSIAKNDGAYIQNLIGKTDFTALDVETIAKNSNFVENAYMYYAMTDNPQKDLLLEKLLSVDKMISFEGMSSGILTDLRIYKKMGNNSVCSAQDIQKVFDSAYTMKINRLRRGETEGLTITFVVEGGQAEKVGLRVGDTILFYDNYPLSEEVRDFFMYDLHTSEQQKNKSPVEMIVLRDKLYRITVQEGLLGIGF